MNKLSWFTHKEMRICCFSDD